jgi:hypothetical protein
MKIFDVRGRLLERFTFRGDISLENVPKINHAGTYVALFCRNGTAVAMKRICNIDR